MIIKDELISKLNIAYTKPFLIYDKMNIIPFYKTIENIIFSENPNEYSFLGQILTDQISEEEKELAYFFVNYRLYNI